MKKNAWYNNDILPTEMIKCALGKKKGWSKLEDTEHFLSLIDLIKKINFKYVADLGCGSAELGRILKNEYNYTGFDLPHIIENVSKKMNPDLNYISYDAYDFNYNVLGEFDLIICNSFISELQKPFEILENIFKHMKKYLIIHRQHFSHQNYFINYNTYGELETIRAFLSVDDFKKILKFYSIEQVHYIHNNSYGDSLLLSKI
jgi:2-polyprenyl-3-methyl-5-hydroxy-6-metoxy-1,4-benzoquinol methylase